MSMHPKQEPMLPLELDVEFYRNAYPDLSSFTDEELERHFRDHGVAEGRMGSPAAARSGFLAAIPIEEGVLEIGPFCNPQLVGERVRYFDVLDSDQLRARARTIGLPDDQCPRIDYVSSTGDISVVDRKFSHIFSSHSIEHQPDLIAHLDKVSNILEISGRYFLIIPDKRYCFDFFLPQSSLADVLAAYVERRTVHSAASVLEHRALLTHNDPVRHWNGDHGVADVDQQSASASNALIEIEQSRGAYIDVHAWKFTPHSFQQIINSLNKIGICDFEIERVYPTIYGSLEFGVVLKRRVSA